MGSRSSCFCWAKFAEEEVLHLGYTTKDEVHWICEECFQDLKEAFSLASLFGRFANKARNEGWQVREIETGHDAILTAPDEVARHLAGAA